MTRKWISGTALLAAATAACQPAPSAGLSDADRSAIEQTMNDALAIFNQQPVDVNAYVQAYYTTDATVMPNGMEAVQGHEAIAAMLSGYPPLSNIRFVQREVNGVGEWAWVWGTYSFDMMMPDMSEPVPDAGKYVEIWRKQADGSWRVHWDIFNSDMAPPAP